MTSPYVVGDPVTGNKFYGRQAELAELLHGGGRTVHVLGMRRIGKTSLLRQVADMVPSICLDFQELAGQPDDFTEQVYFELNRRRQQYDWLPTPQRGKNGFAWLKDAA